MSNFSLNCSWSIVIFLTFVVFSKSDKFNSAGPYSFDYLLGESQDFTTTASVVFVDYEVSADIISSLKNQKKTVICYVSVGSFENWRPDNTSFPESVLGQNYSGWEGEKWLDVRQVDVLLPIMKARFQIAASKGCEGIDPDNMDVISNESGFTITQPEQVTYNRAILKAIHAQNNMMAGLKNSGSQAEDLLDLADFVVSEECATSDECSDYDIFINATPKSKPVFVVEYTKDWTEDDFRSTVCSQFSDTKMSYILKLLNLKNDYTVSCP